MTAAAATSWTRNDTRSKTTKRIPVEILQVLLAATCVQVKLYVHQMHFRRGESYYLHEKWNEIDVHCNVPFSKTSKIDYAIAKGYGIARVVALFFSLVLPSMALIPFHSNDGMKWILSKAANQSSIHDSTTSSSSSSSFVFSSFFNFNKMLHLRA